MGERTRQRPSTPQSPYSSSSLSNSSTTKSPSHAHYSTPRGSYLSSSSPRKTHRQGRKKTRHFLETIVILTFLQILWSQRAWFHDQNADTAMDVPPTKQPQSSSISSMTCAINLYGLPRGFQHYVLPSLVENFMKPNLQYECDYYVHFFNKTSEASGRSGKGGDIDPNEVLLLRDAIETVYNATMEQQHLPKVEIISDTDEDFFGERQSTIQHIQNYPERHNLTHNPYYPTTKNSGFDTSTTINIFKMWHSQTKVFEQMEAHSQTQSYSRVAMLRLDVIYMTPIDIFRVANDPTRKKYPNMNKERGASWKYPLPGPITKPDYYFHDVQNKHAVIPGFASFPINDRMIMGPYEAVKIWATQRWSLMEHFVHTFLPTRPDLAQFGLHDERFMAFVVVPTIRKEANTKVMVDRNLYFFRVRADGSIWILDCPFADAKYKEPKKLEALLQRKCLPVQKSRNPIAPMFVKCPPLEQGGVALK